MELLPVVCLCLLTRCGITSADGNEPVVIPVKQDGNALLPCSLSTKENIEQEYFYWYKVPQNNEKQKEVFLYEKGKHSPSFGSQDDGFKGRVSHFQEELKHGNASIIIRNTKMADSGDYTCTFPERQTFHIKLVVGAAREPSVKTLNQTNNWALLQCVVRDASSKPKVEWKDSSGNKLHAEEPQVTDRGGSYDIILQTTVTKTDRYQCVVTQEEINHQVSAETYVHFSVETGNSGSGAHSSDSPAGLIVGIVVLAVIVVILAAVVFKRHIPLKPNKGPAAVQQESPALPLKSQSSQSV